MSWDKWLMLLGLMTSIGIFEFGGAVLADETADQRNQWITFLSHRSGGNLLYKMRPDGTDVEAILGGELKGFPVVSEGVSLHREPHWTRLSPDRRLFVSWIYESGTPHSKWQGALRPMLFVGDIDRAWSRVLHPAGHEEFAWSPDSKRLALSVFSGAGFNSRSRQRSTRVITCGFDGSHEKVVLEEPGMVVVLDWSPDGERLLLSRRYWRQRPQKSADVFELDLATGKCLPHLLEGTQNFQVGAARYSPLGNDIAVMWHDPQKKYAPNEYPADQSPQGPMGRRESVRIHRLLGKLSLVDRDGKNHRVIQDHPYGQRGPICWSPDGRSVLLSRYLRSDDGRENTKNKHGLAIWSVRIDGSGEQFLTTGWSPEWR